MTETQILVSAFWCYTEFEGLWTEIRSGDEVINGSKEPWIEILFTIPNTTISYVVTAYGKSPEDIEGDKTVLIGKIVGGELEDFNDPELFFQTIEDLNKSEEEALCATP